MDNIRQINEVQYADMFLNEERHYPKFLDDIKTNVFKFVFDTLQKCIKNRMNEYQTTMEINCEYCYEIIFKIILHNGWNTKDKRLYKTFYWNHYNKLYNGKIYKPQIIIDVPINNGKTNYFILDYSVSHELTHLYDDWVALRNGNESISFQTKNVYSNDMIQYLMKRGREFERGIAMLSYLSLKVEKQAFLSQTIQELKQIGCSQFNYREKIKETVLYNNISKGYKMFLNGIRNADNKMLYNLNAKIITEFSGASIPKCDVNTFDAEKYRERLIRWADNIYHRIMKSFGSVVSYYIDELEEEWNKHTSMIII
jgi:hypothetical protein